MIPGRDEWGRTQLERRRAVRLLPDRDVYAAHPEDVIIAGILQVSGELVDRASIRRWAEKLGLTEAWDAVLSRLDQATGAQQ